MKETILKDDLLFHSTHGLCRVAAVTLSARSKEADYLLLPVSANQGKVRFTIPGNSLESSGFSKLISVKEAQAILEYFKTGDKKDFKCSQAWAQAMTVCAESCGKELVKDKRQRQMLERSLKGLAGELALVLKLTLKEMAEKIQKNLEAFSKINPLVLTTLEAVSRD